MHANWITMAHPACSIWKTEPHEKEREQAYIHQVPQLHGSFLFEKSFPVEKPLSAATLCICGLGYYEVFVNGKMPDPGRVLSPVLSDYFRLCRYDTYDVSALLQLGENVLRAEICDGWFAPESKYWGWQYSWHGDARLIAELVLTFTDGTSRTIGTDPSWLWAPGTVTRSSIYDGETVNFNLCPENWKNAVPAEAPTENLCPATVPPIRICRTLEPIRITRLSDMEALYDFGENGAAIPAFRFKGKKGDTVTLRFAEFINADGTPDFTSQNRAESTDVFILSDEVCTCQSRFVWHGYRYVLVTLSDDSIRLLSAQSHVIHSELTETGSFSCDREELNHLHEVCKRTELACLLGVPLDCPQRDERKAWLGDAHVTSELCLYNFDMRDFYASLLEDIRLDTLANGCTPFICPGDFNRTTVVEGFTTSLDWSIAYPVILWEYHMRYHDTPLLQKHLPALKQQVHYYASRTENDFVPYGWFGDWFSLDFPAGLSKVVFAPGSEDHRQNPPFAATMFYCKLLRLVRDIALECGDPACAQEVSRLLDVSAEALYRRCYHRETGKFGSGGQFLSVFALSEHLVKPEDEAAVFAELLSSLEESSYHPLVGVVGLRMLFDVLSAHGRPDLAYRVLTAEGYPGIMDMAGHGRTTLPEDQDGSGSGCHCMFASPDAQLYKLLGGITVDRTAEVPVLLKPYCPADIQNVRCSQTLPEGTLCVSWKREQHHLQFEIHIPQGVFASLTLPDGTTSRLSAGTHRFTTENP